MSALHLTHTIESNRTERSSAMHRPIEQLTRGLVAGLGITLAVAGVAWAAQLTIPHSFTSGQKALAAQVNANFNAVSTAVNDHESRLAALEAALQTLQTQLDQKTQELDVANQKIADLETNTTNLLPLNQYLTVTAKTVGVNNGAVVRLTGVNLQVVNGQGSTATTNGFGNLIVGYDEVGGRCSNPDFTPAGQFACENDRLPATWTVGPKTGSHNIVGGDAASYSSYGGLVVGQNNWAKGTYASVSGGSHSDAEGNGSSVSGGIGNIASGEVSSISSGYLNTASGLWSSVSGGRNNLASGQLSSVSGGSSNTASGQNSSVSGGMDNTASGQLSSVSGGQLRSATGLFDWRAGGLFEDL